MNLGAIFSALPWLRRAWQLLPPPLRVPVLLVAAGAGLWLAVTGRRELRERAAAARPGEPQATEGSW